MKPDAVRESPRNTPNTRKEKWAEISDNIPKLTSGWRELKNLSDLVGFSFEDAVKSLGLEPEAVDDMYREFHQVNLAATVEGLIELIA